MKQVWKIKDFSGGLSDSDEIGLKSSFSWGEGLDIHSEPRVLKVLQKLKKESPASGANEVTDLILSVAVCSDGNTYLFGDAGKIYKRTSAGVYTLVYTDVNGRIGGAAEFNGYLYWATSNKLSRKPIPGQADWSDIEHDWQNITLDAEFHPMIICWSELYIGSGEDLASVDIAGVFTSSALDLHVGSGERIRALNSASSYIIIHTWKGNNINEGKIFTWDGRQATYLTVSETSEAGIRASLFLKNFLYIWAGTLGNFYYYDSSQIELLRKLPGIFTTAIFSEILPEARTVKAGKVLFGLSANTGAATRLGVYSWGQFNKNYPLVINFDYPISTGTTTSIKIGIVKQIGNTTIVSWKDGSDYGVDVLDEDNKQAQGIYESIMFDNEDPFRKKRASKFTLKFKKLPANCSIDVYYRRDYETTGGDNNDGWLDVGTIDTVGDVVAHLPKVFEFYNVQIKIVLKTNVNVTPELLGAFVEYEPIDYTYRK